MTAWVDARTWLSALALAALTLPGCASFDGSGTRAVVNVCATSEDCAGGSCEDGICVSTSTEPFDIAIEAAANAGTSVSSAPTFRVLETSIDGPRTIDVTLPPRTTIRGIVRFGPANVVAKITVREAEPAIVDSPLSAYTTTSSVPELVDEVQTSYALDFARGKRVRVRVEPLSVPAIVSEPYRSSDASSVFPPIEVELALDEAVERVDFDYPMDIFEPCTPERRTLCTVGVTLTRTAQSDDGPLDGLLVALLAEDGRRISSTGRTVGTTVGEASLRIGRLPSELGPVELLVGPTGPSVSDESAPYRDTFPTYRFPDVVPLGQITAAVPVSTPIEYIASVENANLTPLGGATVRFVARALDDGYAGPRSFERLATTSPVAPGTTPGRFQIGLFPGTYDVLVTPANGTADGVLYRTIAVERPPSGNTVQGQIFQVPRATPLSGRVQTFTGEDAPDVTLQARPFPSSNGRASSSSSDVYGGFSLYLDPGDYDLVAIPAASTDFAQQIIELAGEPPEFVSVTLVPPVVVSGTVRSSDGAPLPGARVTVYRRLHRFVERLVPVATATAEVDGTYRVLLAP